MAARHEAKLVIMYSRCRRPHEFGAPASGDVIQVIRSFLQERVVQALQSGLRPEQLILDSGCGAFLSDDPQISLTLAERYPELAELGFPLMLGLSRKGFLKQPGERSPADRDAASARLAFDIAARMPAACQLYLRVHSLSVSLANSQLVSIG